MKALSKIVRIGAVAVCLILAPVNAAFATNVQRVVAGDAASRVQKIYQSQLGVKEQGNNSGKEVEAYLKYVGLPKGNPWCAAFVCWVLGQAGIENPRTGWSPGLLPESKVIWKKSYELRVVSYEKVSGNIGMNRYNSSFFITSLVPRSKPEWEILTTAYRTQPITRNTQPSSGDIFGLYFPEKGRIAHVGFVDEWDGTWVLTVEGNTNLSGSRDGDGVYRKRRLVSTIYKVARYVLEERRVRT